MSWIGEPATKSDSRSRSSPSKSSPSDYCESAQACHALFASYPAKTVRNQDGTVRTSPRCGQTAFGSESGWKRSDRRVLEQPGEPAFRDRRSLERGLRDRRYAWGPTSFLVPVFVSASESAWLRDRAYPARFQLPARTGPYLGSMSPCDAADPATKALSELKSSES